MIDDIGGVTSRLVGLALDASLMRHQVIANNIANASTSGFDAKRLVFESYFSGFATSSINKSADATLENEIASLRVRLNAGNELIASTDKEVQLDAEMVTLTENVLRYRALLEANSKRGEILKMAVKEGRS